MHQDLYRLRLDTEAMELLTPHEGEARFEQVNVTPDGRGLYLATDLGGDFLRPAYLDLTTRELQTLDTIAWDVDAVKLSPDGRVLAAYERCCQQLRDDLGVEPDDATHALYEQIRTNQLSIEHAELRTASNDQEQSSIREAPG